MSRSVTVNFDHTIVGGRERKATDVVTITNAEFDALTSAGRFSGGSPVLTDGGSAGAGEDSVEVQAAVVAAPAALTSAAAAGGTPTKAEYDALRADVSALRTTVANTLVALKGSGKPMASS